MAPDPRHRPRWHAEYLDALRGLAVLAVVLVHVGTSSALPQPWNDIAYSGQRGVQLFFVVSAFTLLLSSENRRKAERHPTRNFFLRRFFRIAPMYYTAIGLTLLLAPARAGSLHDLLLGLVFLHSLSPSAILHVAPGVWTVGDEMLFYALLPLLIRSIRSFRSALLWFLLTAPAMAALSFALEHLDPADKAFFAFFWFPVELPIFLLGIVAFFFWKEHLAAACPRGSLRAKRLSLALLAAFCLVYLLNLPLDNRKLYFAGLGCALLLLALAAHPWRPLVNPVTVYLGRISFSLYLLHVWALDPAMRLAARLPPATPQALVFGVRFAATLLPSVAAASFTWLFLEERGIALGRRLIASLEGRRLPPAAPQSHTLHDLAAAATHGSSPDEQF